MNGARGEGYGLAAIASAGITAPAPRVAPSRPAIWSATRSELAMIVSVGFTAPMEGKKPPSVT